MLVLFMLVGYLLFYLTYENVKKIGQAIREELRLK